MFEYREIPLAVDVPIKHEILYGREVTIARAWGARQEGEVGDLGNEYGFQNTASLAAGALWGAIPESDLIARGLDSGVCNSTEYIPLCGGISLDSLVRLLRDALMPVRAESASSLEELAQHIESGSQAIVFVNAGEFWDQVNDLSAADANYPLVVDGVARDADSQEIYGFFVRDPAKAGTSVFMDAAKAVRCWLDSGGWQIVPSGPRL